MNIELEIKDIKYDLNYAKKCEYDHVTVDVYKLQDLLTAYEKEKEKNNNVLGLIFEYGQTDGEHHKAWVIDQIVRIITENNYDKWVQHYEYDEETDEDYFWDVGIAP